MSKSPHKNELEKPCTNFNVSFSHKDFSNVDEMIFFSNENIANLFIKCVDIGIWNSWVCQNHKLLSKYFNCLSYSFNYVGAYCICIKTFFEINLLKNQVSSSMS